METLSFDYRFFFADGRRERFEVRLDANTLESIGETREIPPEWTRLGFEQCPNCPLAAQTHPHCPLAVHLVKVVSRFEGVRSYEELRVEAVTPERTVSKQTTAQRGVSSLMGLIMATSGCPHTAFFRPMARFHLSLASDEETLYRAASMYLLAQYFRRETGGNADLEFVGLTRIYGNLQVLNAAMAKRLRAASREDAAVNAVVILDFFAKTWSYSIEDQLEEIRPLFAPYLSGE